MNQVQKKNLFSDKRSHLCHDGRPPTKRRLQHASVLLTVSDWLDLRGVHQPPEVVLVVGAIQAQAQSGAGKTHHCRDAGGGGVPRILGLQLHPGLELIERRCDALRVGDK